MSAVVAPLPPPPGATGSVGLVRSVAALLMAAGLGLAVIRFAGRSPADGDWAAAYGSLALGAPVAAAGVLALLALRGRAVLLVPAAALLVPMSLLSFALVTLPLLIPAGLLFAAYGHRGRAEHRSSERDLVTIVVVLALLIAAVVVLFAHQDPRSYTTATGGGSTSDVITPLEATVSLLLTLNAVLAGRYLARR